MTAEPIPPLDLNTVARAFPLHGRFRNGAPYGNGHINDTFVVVFDQAGTLVRYILQRINSRIFKDVPALMENIERVTAHATWRANESVGDDSARRALTLVSTREGLPHYSDAASDRWRCYLFIERASTHDIIESPRMVREGARAFGEFHLHHDILPNLKARSSWSTSFGRPPLNNLLPNESVNEAQQTLTINNPSLLPQTAENWDATLEYYFEPAGSISVSWFHKTIKDYIVNGIPSGTVGSGNNNGFNGEYDGFMILTRANAGTATVQGWEFDYRQQFTFLPGLLKGLGANANYTVIDTSGDFGGGEQRSTGEVPGFIPRVGNLGLVWRYRNLSTRVSLNYVSRHITNFTSVGSPRNLYRYSRKIVSAGAAYHFRPWLNFTCDVSNLTNEPEAFYRGNPDQMQRFNIAGTTITFGVNGRF